MKMTGIGNSDVAEVDVHEYIVISVYQFLSVGNVCACERII